MPLQRSFYFVRHGETDWNKEGRLQGHTNIPLNETGRAQARAAQQIIARLPIDQVVTSTLDRAIETAEILCQTSGKEIMRDARLCERSFGSFEGMDVSIIDKHKHEAIARGETPEENGYPCPPEAEPYADFRQRVLGIIDFYQASFPEQSILFVAHGGLYRVLRRCLFATVDASPNVCPYHFEKRGKEWRLHDLRALF